MESSSRPFSLCVYCGSRPGTEPAYAEAARQVGHEIGRRGWRLVYGGGRAGLMGTVADAAIAAGATTVGVIPTSLMSKELGHFELTELHVVDTMHQRKLMMAERADAFLALPGGIGTFEELFEVWSWRQLGYHVKPIGLLNAASYYDALLAFLAQAERLGLMTSEQHALLDVGSEPAPLLDRLAAAASRGAAQDLRRI
ncbi:MAG: TIGR00730 family Rossman fold protein [Proteobacteria bacterium]|nr:TIGR00730 family Rossman fold protein [Pseudomonadota bacterium]